MLKVVEIEYSGDWKRLSRKIEELYEFMHFELKTLLVREAVVALNYLKGRSALTFFGEIRPQPAGEARGS